MSGFSGIGYQLPWTSLVPDATITDGNTSTGIDASDLHVGIPPTSVTAGVMLPGPSTISAITIDWGVNGVVGSSAVEYSTDSTTWTPLTASAPTSAGALSIVHTTVSGLPVTGQYVRVSLSNIMLNPGETEQHVAIREVTVSSTIIVNLFYGISAGPGQWIENGYCMLVPDGYDSLGTGPTLLPTRFSSYITTKDNTTWARYDQPNLPHWTVDRTLHTINGPMWEVSGMVRLRSGTLVSLLYNQGNQRTYTAKSRDKGKTWEYDITFNEIIPQLEVPPCLTCIGDDIIACWVDSSDQPYFAISHNAGLDWS